jgi:hypothetical protein
MARHSLKSAFLAIPLVAALAAAGCTPSASRAYLRDEDLAALKTDTKETCLVAAQIFSVWGDLQGGIKLETTGGTLVTAGESGSFFKGGTCGFAFVNVPKGPFRLGYFNFHHATGKEGHMVIEFDNLNHSHVVSTDNHGVGDIPNEMSGTCNGGFVWLGVFKGDTGGLFSSPKMRLGNDSVAAGYALRDLKAKLAGSPWAAEIDHPMENTPLPAGQAVVEKLDPVKQAAAQKAAAEAGKAVVAKMMAESRPVTLPPSDAGAVVGAAGTYMLSAINGKPLPYTYEANKCVMRDGQVELKADGAYATKASLDCAGTNYSFPTSGLFGLVGGTATFAVGVGPVPASGSTVTRLAGATLTTVAGADTYTYQKR